MEQPTTTVVVDVTVAFLLTFGPERYRPARDELTTSDIYRMFVGGFEMQVGQYRASYTPSDSYYGLPLVGLTFLLNRALAALREGETQRLEFADVERGFGIEWTFSLSSGLVTARGAGDEIGGTAPLSEFREAALEALVVAFNAADGVWKDFSTSWWANGADREFGWREWARNHEVPPVTFARIFYL